MATSKTEEITMVPFTRSRHEKLAVGFLILCLGAMAPGQKSSAQVCPEHEYLGNHPAEWNGDYAPEVQGVAHDEAHWYITQTKKIWQIPVGSDLGPKEIVDLGPPFPPFEVPLPIEGARRVDISRDLDAMMAAHAPENEEGKYDHFGDLDELRGYLFIPIEGSAVTTTTLDLLGRLIVTVVEPAPPPIVGVYRTDDLSFVGSAVLTANRERGRNTAWIAAREIDGEVFIYSSYKEVSDEFPLFEYAVDMDKLAIGDAESAFTFNRDIYLETEPLKTMQGGVFSPYGDLYLVNGAADESVGDQNGGIHLFAPNGSLIDESVNEGGLGGFKYEYVPFSGTDFNGEEPEGIDWWDLSDGRAPEIGGQLHVLLLDNPTPIFEDYAVYLKHYDVSYECKADLDSDGDGLSDFDEVVVYGTDPYEGDSDGDGVNDGEEVTVFGTNPRNADTDDDGQQDGDELACGSDPLDPGSVSPDFDGDQLRDCVDPDDDGDGVVDEADRCPETLIPDPVIPTSGVLKNNRYALLDDDIVFDRNSVGNGDEPVVTTADTAGCNATQIADALGLGRAHYESGITKSVLEAWIGGL